MNEILSHVERLAYLGTVDKVMAALANEYGRDRPLPSAAHIRSRIELAKMVPQRRDMAEDRNWPADDGGYFRVKGLVTLDTPQPKFIEPEPLPVVVSEAVPTPVLRWMSPREIIAAIASDYGVTAADITGRCRRREYTFPRFAAAHVLRARGNSLPQVGKFLGGRDHSTILHACEQFANRATGNDWAIVRQYYREELG
jgi:hypothetical protein